MLIETLVFGTHKKQIHWLYIGINSILNLTTKKFTYTSLINSKNMNKSILNSFIVHGIKILQESGMVETREWWRKKRGKEGRREKEEFLDEESVG
jgi:hypothetical protein